MKFSCLLVAVVWLASGCSPGKMVVRGTETILDSGVVAMNQETDLELAQGAMPANLKLLEGMLIEDPGNTRLHLYAAEGFYGYTFGFVEMQDSHRAQHLYRRCYEHARVALQQSGLTLDPETSTPEEFEAEVGKAGQKAVPAMFWTASCLANWVNLNRNSPAGIAELASAATLMQRVIVLDDTFYHGGPHLFFGVYYGGRSPLFGGDFRLSEEHFRRAAEINDDKLLLVDVLQAEYLDRQRLDREAFHRHLTRVIEAPDNLAPDMALMNAVAKQQAALLLGSEDDWF
ncbi:MAG: TRAP transporter TatT component family protein [Gammaproteobacteria bacterium]